MAQAPRTPEQHRETITLWARADYVVQAGANLAKVSRSTFLSQLNRAKSWMATPEGAEWGRRNHIAGAGGDVPVSKPTVVIADLTARLKEAEKKLAEFERETVTASQVREYILGMADQPNKPDVKWLNDRAAFPYNHGIPTLFLSDIHYGEVVEPEKVLHSNTFNSDICEARVKTTFDTTIHLTQGILKNPQFPGICLVLGGDMITGNIHEELLIGSDRRIMAQSIEIADIIHAGILKLVRIYRRVFVVGFPGNHGRTTRKPSFKFYAETNFDWLIYQMLERFLAKLVADGTVVFVTPPAQDVTFRVAGRRYRGTHGDQFRGGDGIIGPLGPITRGDNKKRNVALSLPTDDEHYDTLIVGHFHQLYQSHKLIINGSPKGYDEYAMANNFAYEPPQQALWLTHEKYGINHFMPVLCEEPPTKAVNKSWAAWQDGQASGNVKRISDLVDWSEQ